MNGNELNNMTKRYKEEMMRIYRNSGQKSSSQNSGVMGRGAGMSGNPIPNNSMVSRSACEQMAANRAVTDHGTDGYTMNCHGRDIGGTPAANVPDASHFSMNSDASEQTNGNDAAVTNTAAEIRRPSDMHVRCDCRFPSAESIISNIANTPMTLPLTPADNPPPVYDGSSQIQPRGIISDVVSGGADNLAESFLNSIILNAFPQSADYTADVQAETATAEVYPDFALPAAVTAESDDAIPETAGYYPSQGWVSLTGDDSWGFLQFDITANGSYPLQNAIVTVRKMVPGGTGLLRILYTNRNGLTPTIALPAPSLMLPTANATRPFSEYIVTVRARGFYTVRNITVAVFAGSKTVQPIDMISLSYNNGIYYPPQPRNDSDNTVG